MKNLKLLLLVVIALFTVHINGQIKLHSSGGISIGSTTDPNSATTVFADPVIFEDAVSFNGGISEDIIPASVGKHLGSPEVRWSTVYASNLYLYGSIHNSLKPWGNMAYDLGTSTLRWRDAYVEEIDVDGVTIAALGSPTAAHSIVFDMSYGGYLEINNGPTNYVAFNSDKSYYNFDDDVKSQGILLDSDITLKDDIAKIKDSGTSIEKLKKLEGITFKFKEDKDEMKYAGFSAQELRKVFPDLVFEDEEGLLSVNYIGLIPYLVEAMKEQEARINELERMLIERDEFEALK